MIYSGRSKIRGEINLPMNSIIHESFSQYIGDVPSSLPKYFKKSHVIFTLHCNNSGDRYNDNLVFSET